MREVGEGKLSEVDERKLKEVGERKSMEGGRMLAFIEATPSFSTRGANAWAVLFYIAQRIQVERASVSPPPANPQPSRAFKQGLAYY